MPLNERGQYRRENHRDRVFLALRDSMWRIVRTDEDGMHNNIIHTETGQKIGEVHFTKQNLFLGGTFYRKVVVSGRTITKAQALAEFEALIRTYYERN